MTVALILFSIVFVSLCVGASVVSLSAYAISRRRILACLSVFILAYAGEQTFILLNEFLSHNLAFDPSMFQGSENLVFHLFAGVALCQSLWLAVLFFFDSLHRQMVLVPPAIMLVISLCIAFAPMEASVQKWGVYSMRQVFLLCVGIYCIAQYVSVDSDEVVRGRCKKKMVPFLILFTLVVLTFAEDTWVMLFLDPSSISNAYFLEYLYRRNTCESLFVLFVLCVTVCMSVRTLLLKRDEVPSAFEASHRQLQDVLPYFAKKYGLSGREQEIVAYVINGETNDWIARELQVSVGTVKTHTHNIFKKTGASNRKDLTNVFWAS